jgi:hypothetical protein
MSRRRHGWPGRSGTGRRPLPARRSTVFWLAIRRPERANFLKIKLNPAVDMSTGVR